MYHKIDERKDGIQKIKKDIENTQHNVETTNRVIESTSNEDLKNRLEEKNENRIHAIEDMVKEVSNRIMD